MRLRRVGSTTFACELAKPACKHELCTQCVGVAIKIATLPQIALMRRVAGRTARGGKEGGKAGLQPHDLAERWRLIMEQHTERCNRRGATQDKSGKEKTDIEKGPSSGLRPTKNQENGFN